MSEAVQLEQLLNEKSNVEGEAKELEDEQRKLNMRAKALTEKIIQELKKRNSSKQETLNKLQTTVDDLETQLNALSVSHVSKKADAASVDKDERAEAVESFEETSQETIDDSVSVTEVAEPISVDTEKERKKRKFF